MQVWLSLLNQTTRCSGGVRRIAASQPKRYRVARYIASGAKRLQFRLNDALTGSSPQVRWGKFESPTRTTPVKR